MKNSKRFSNTTLFLLRSAENIFESIHEENLTEWRSQLERALQPAKKSSQERKELGAEKEKVKKLEKELLRKDKALAEVSALLILKKKPTFSGDRRRTSEFCRPCGMHLSNC